MKMITNLLPNVWELIPREDDRFRRRPARSHNLQGLYEKSEVVVYDV